MKNVVASTWKTPWRVLAPGVATLRHARPSSVQQYYSSPVHRRRRREASNNGKSRSHVLLLLSSIRLPAASISFLRILCTIADSPPSRARRLHFAGLPGKKARTSSRSRPRPATGRTDSGMKLSSTIGHYPFTCGTQVLPDESAAQKHCRVPAVNSDSQSQDCPTPLTAVGRHTKQQPHRNRFSRSLQTAGGIYLPDSKLGKTNEGEVVAVGPGRVTETGTKVPVNVAIGDKVLLPEYGGTTLKLGDDELSLFRDEDILGKFQVSIVCWIACMSESIYAARFALPYVSLSFPFFMRSSVGCYHMH